MNKHADSILQLIEENNIKIFAEIGVFKSRTCKKVLKECRKQIKEYWAIDQWLYMGKGHGRIGKATQEDMDSLYVSACNLMRFYKQLKVLRLSSQEAVTIFSDNYFDMVFIDANHQSPFVDTDIEIWKCKVKEGGLLTGHDYGNKHKDVKKAVDEILGEDKIIVKEGHVWVYKNG